MLGNTYKMDSSRYVYYDPTVSNEEFNRLNPLFNYRCKILTAEFSERLNKFIKHHDDAEEYCTDELVAHFRHLWKDPKIYLPADIPHSPLHENGWGALIDKPVSYYIGLGIYTPELYEVDLPVRELETGGRRALYKGKVEELAYIDDIMEFHRLGPVKYESEQTDKK
jgi:hypothetical protein